MKENSEADQTLDGSDAWELFLLKLRYAHSIPQRIAANKPLLLDDHHYCWITYSGNVDIFFTKMVAIGEFGRRHYLFSVKPGAALFGIHAGDDFTRLLVSGEPGTEILKVEMQTLVDLSKDVALRPFIASLIDNWITGISMGIISNLPPQEYVRIQNDQTYDLPQDTVLRPLREVMWVKHVKGAFEFAGEPEWAAPAKGQHFPVTRHTWIKITETGPLAACNTETLLTQERFWKDLDQYNRSAMEILLHRMAAGEEKDITQLRHKIDAELAQVDDAVLNLAAILHKTEAARFLELQSQDPLVNACLIIGRAGGILFRQPPELKSRGMKVEPLEEIARASRVRFRRVALREKWWQVDNGPLLAYFENTHQPVALLPVKQGYEIHDPVARSVTRVTEKTTLTLSPFAYTFYRPFPDRAIRLLDMLRFAIRGTLKDVRTLVLIGIMIGILTLVVPVITGYLLDTIIPTSQRSQLLPIGLALFTSAVAVAVFGILRGIAMLRFETRTEATLQAAIMDHVLKLPIPFFRKYTAGDLGQRTMGISTIQNILSQHVISAVLSFASSIFSLIVLFFYSSTLGWIVTGLVFVVMVVMLAAAYVQVGYQRESSEFQGQLAGTTLQMINGIAKLRVSGAHRRAFARWANLLRDQQQTSFRSQLLGVGLSTFNETYGVFILMAIFAAVIFASQVQLSTGSFVAFNTASAQFITAAFGLSSSLTAIISVIPLYERMRPILQTLPEVSEVKNHPGELTGEISVNRVSFHYEKDGPPILENVSLDFKPGEFVAIVGPSGSGKSTLLRLLLGFETPDSGTILYDNQDLSRLDLSSLRRQIGVVLQNGQLIAGDIFTNIIGTSTLTVQDAWEAAEKACLAEDIHSMPMGMHTVISEGSRTISGGQKQRLLIARAIVRKSRIVIFDEATSSLDNKTQAVVSKSLKELDATRIVIAHRLSTIASADRIHVLRNGRVEQSGSYEELMRERGLFADLAKRQLS